MSTPRLLDNTQYPRPPHRPDPIGVVIGALLTVVVVGLFIAAVLAVYTWSTPSAEEPVVIATAGIFALTLLLMAAVPAIRRARSLGWL